MLDLVEDPNRTVPSDAFVYGNVIIKPADVHNGRIIHFGGDQSGSDRAGTLYFFNNTIVINNESKTSSIFAVSREKAAVKADNNIFFKNTGQSVNVWTGFENVNGDHNWISNGIGLTDVLHNNIFGIEPGFVDSSLENFSIDREFALPEYCGGL